jgi:hypothetical protein
VESSCELGNETSGSIKCWELPSGCTSCGLSSGTQLHRVSYLVICHIQSGFICRSLGPPGSYLGPISLTCDVTLAQTYVLNMEFIRLCGLVVRVFGC